MRLLPYTANIELFVATGYPVPGTLSSSVSGLPGFRKRSTPMHTSIAMRSFALCLSWVLALLSISLGTLSTISCANFLTEMGLAKTGSLQVEIRQSGGSSRTVLPPVVLPTDLLFDLALTRGTTSITATGLSADKLALSAIPPSEAGKSDWTLTATGKKGDLALFSGSAAIAINVGANTVTLDLAPLQTATGMGNLTFTLSWPHELFAWENSSNSVDLYWTPSIDEAALRNSPLSGDSVSTIVEVVQNIQTYSISYNAPIASGDYFLVVDLYKGERESVIASVMELVRIFDGQTSEGTVSLDAGDISGPPEAPTNCYIASSQSARLTSRANSQVLYFFWTDVSETENGYIIYDDTDLIDVADLSSNSESFPTSEIYPSNPYDPGHEYSIAAYNAFGESPRVPFEQPPPPLPSRLVALP